MGRATVPIPDPLVPGAARRRRSAAAPLGVNVAGYFRSVLGVGEAARQVVTALERNGVAVSTVGLTASNSGEDESLAQRTDGRGEHAINLICVNADVLTPFADEMGPAFFAGRHSIGLWWWEVSTFPDRFLGAFEHVDEVWAGSRHVADALSAVSPVPVVHVPQPVAVEDPPTDLDRAALGLPEGFLFLFSFDFHSVFARKNPLGAIEAFTRAFAPGAGAKLVIKTINGDKHPEDAARLQAAAAAHPDVVLYDRYVSRRERDAITAACDCYVSLHRSEGFGFTVAEAMAYGRPAIVTAYSGTMDFTTAANAYLVDYRLVPIGEGADPYPPDGEWAEPDLDDAARLMREVFEQPERGAGARGARAGRPARAPLPGGDRQGHGGAPGARAQRLHRRPAAAGAGARRGRRAAAARQGVGRPGVAVLVPLRQAAGPRPQGAAARPEALHGARARRRPGHHPLARGDRPDAAGRGPARRRPRRPGRPAALGPRPRARLHGVVRARRRGRARRRARAR